MTAANGETNRYARANTHVTHVKPFAAAGDRYYRATCRDCPWHGATTSDRARAEQEAADHELARVIGR